MCWEKAQGKHLQLQQLYSDLLREKIKQHLFILNGTDRKEFTGAESLWADFSTVTVIYSCFNVVYLSSRGFPLFGALMSSSGLCCILTAQMIQEFYYYYFFCLQLWTHPVFFNWAKMWETFCSSQAGMIQ